MSPEEKELLKRSIALSEENNDILRSIQRSMRLARFMSILYWVFIIGSAVGAYYIVQPYVEQLTQIYGGAKSGIDGGVGAFSGLLDNF
ncbi:MAG: hypothetical protein ABL917_02860 [Parcubacteria group bacterium]